MPPDLQEFIDSLSPVDRFLFIQIFEAATESDNPASLYRLCYDIAHQNGDTNVPAVQVIVSGMGESEEELQARIQQQIAEFQEES